MITSAVKAKLRAGGSHWEAWLLLGSPSAAEVMASAGFDWLIIEGEHAAAGMNDVQLMLQAMNGSPTVPILRVPWNDRVAVKVALDVGVKGIMFPMINSREEALEAVRACWFPPEGVRGIGSGRSNLYGMNPTDYRGANEDLLIFIIIEHEQAVEHIDEILSVPGIDGAFFGFSDYAASIGLTGQLTHPRVIGGARQGARGDPEGGRGRRVRGARPEPGPGAGAPGVPADHAGQRCRVYAPRGQGGAGGDGLVVS